jgi:hypothetical protein
MLMIFLTKILAFSKTSYFFLNALIILNIIVNIAIVIKYVNKSILNISKDSILSMKLINNTKKSIIL